jgi:hypothetical protein
VQNALKEEAAGSLYNTTCLLARLPNLRHLRLFSGWTNLWHLLEGQDDGVFEPLTNIIDCANATTVTDQPLAWLETYHR